MFTTSFILRFLRVLTHRVMAKEDRAWAFGSGFFFFFFYVAWSTQSSIADPVRVVHPCVSLLLIPSHRSYGHSPLPLPMLTTPSHPLTEISSRASNSRGGALPGPFRIGDPVPPKTSSSCLRQFAFVLVLLHYTFTFPLWSRVHFLLFDLPLSSLRLPGELAAMSTCSFMFPVPASPSFFFFAQFISNP